MKNNITLIVEITCGSIILYSSFELSSNGINASEAIARQGANKIDTPIWWDKN